MKILLIPGLCLLLAGCAGPKRDALIAPQPLLAPYDTRGGELTWAVAVPMNESGTSAVEVLEIGDSLVAAIEECRGIRCIPMNRTIQAMRDLNLDAVRSASDARQLALAVGADAILVSSITAHDPYTPELGIAAALFARPGAMLPDTSPTPQDPRSLTRMTSEPGGERPKSFGDRPVCVVSEHMDARNHQVLMDLRTYAQGRQLGESALGWRQYTAAMPMYTRFCAYRTINQILKQESIRIGTGGAVTDNGTDNLVGGKRATNQALEGQTDRRAGPEKNKRADVGPGGGTGATIGAITPE